MREFETGATRDADDSKLDYEGFLSPMVLARFAQYMHQHRIQANGEVRDSDNWQKGIPKEAYMKSLWRHFMELWVLHREGDDIQHEQEIALQEALCAIMFNVMGYLFEEITLVGMHLPGQPDDPAYEGDLRRVTLAPPKEQGLDPLEAEEQVRPKDAFPCHDPNMEYHADGDYFTPKPCVVPGCGCSPKQRPSCRLRCSQKPPSVGGGCGA